MQTIILQEPGKRPSGRGIHVHYGSLLCSTSLLQELSIVHSAPEQVLFFWCGLIAAPGKRVSSPGGDGRYNSLDKHSLLYSQEEVFPFEFFNICRTLAFSRKPDTFNYFDKLCTFMFSICSICFLQFYLVHISVIQLLISP